jgi:hypothetical protein
MKKELDSILREAKQEDNDPNANAMQNNFMKEQ